MQEQKLFHKDFTLMVIGQIISLFGNNILRFALPLYLLNQTGSASLLGAVSALSFIPMILLSPVGGIIADRVNKRNVMVVLDFMTAAVVSIFFILLGQMNLVILMVITMMILFGIQGSYQPAVQASIPVLMAEKQVMAASAIINQVNSLAGLIGPVFGGILYSVFGLPVILWISIICFTFSAIMEIFIKIPFEKQKKAENIREMVVGDIKTSVHYIYREKPIILKILFLIAGLNLFLSSMIIVGFPVIITQIFDFNEATGNQLYGYTQGILAAGGLAGGILTGILSSRLKLKSAFAIILSAGILVLPMAFGLFIQIPDFYSYLILTVCGFLIMAMSTLFTIQMMVYVQKTTPEHILGKVMSFIMAGCMCAQPLGQLLYGFLFEYINASYVVFISSAACILITFLAKNSFKELAASENDEKLKLASEISQ